MKIFKYQKDGLLYTIVQNLVGRCICGRCQGNYTATRYPRGWNSHSMALDSIEDFEEVGER